MNSIRAITHQRIPIMIRCRPLDRNNQFRGHARPLDLYDRAFTTSTPGIVITRFAHGEPLILEPYPVLTHEASGGYIGGPYASLRTALAIAGALGPLGDWMQPDILLLRLRIEAYARINGLYDWFVQVRTPDPKVMELLAAAD